MLNYRYALLEAEYLGVPNSVGLYAHVGFLHEMQSGKNSLAYDMQELFRFPVDLAGVNLVERERVTAKDFVRTEELCTEAKTCGLRPTGTRKMTEDDGRSERMVQQYYGWISGQKELMWSYVMMLKGRGRSWRTI